MTKRMEGTMRMIVIGADTHKDTHTAVAVADGTGQLIDELTAPVRKAGFAQHLDWARGQDSEWVWAVENRRHVSGGLERFLVASGERVVRVPPKLMGKSRKGSRERGKSDPIDAANVARAALQEGVENLPAAYLDERSSASPRTCLSRSKASGGEVKDGSPALPQAPPGASGLAAFASI